MFCSWQMFFYLFFVLLEKNVIFLESQKTESEKAMAMFEERKQMTISSSPPRSKPQPKERITLIGGKKGLLKTGRP